MHLLVETEAQIDTKRSIKVFTQYLIHLLFYFPFGTRVTRWVGAWLVTEMLRAQSKLKEAFRWERLRFLVTLAELHGLRYSAERDL